MGIKGGDLEDEFLFQILSKLNDKKSILYLIPVRYKMVCSHKKHKNCASDKKINVDLLHVTFKRACVVYEDLGKSREEIFYINNNIAGISQQAS